MKIPKLFYITIDFDFLILLMSVVYYFVFHNTVIAAFLFGVALAWDGKEQLKRLKMVILKHE